MWKIHVLLNVLKTLFSTYLDWVFSWFLNLQLDYSWFLILDSWNLNLETRFLNREIKFPLDSRSVLDSILNSFSWAFCHHLCYHQNSLNQSWFNIMKLASTTMLTKLKWSPPYDFQASHACLEFPVLFHSYGPDLDATVNYHWTSHWMHSSLLVKLLRQSLS